MSKLKMLIVVLMLALTACMYTPDSAAPTANLNQEEDAVLVVKTPETVGDGSPIIHTAYIEKRGRDYFLEVIGSGFTATVAVYGHRSVFGSGMSAVLSNVYVDENHLTIRLPYERMPEECRTSCEVEIQIIYGTKGSVSNKTVVVFNPSQLEPTATPTPTDTTVPTATPLPTETPLPPNTSTHAPLMCTALENTQIWAWLPPESSFYFLGRSDETRYEDDYILVQVVDTNYTGWMHRDYFGVSDEEYYALTQTSEDNRCYPLSPEQQAMQDPYHLWVVTNPDLGTVPLFCSPDENSEVRINMNETFVLVEQKYGDWLYGRALGNDGTMIYGWFKTNQTIPRTVPINLPEASQPPTHC